ncbi:MAG: carbon-nitrogen hydrolase family protein [Planctomycetota bacterium]
MGTVKIAMCQIFSLDGDREGNFVRIENAVREAKDAGVQVACFPETVILGWVNPDAHERACSIPGTDSDRLCRLARNNGIYLCVGLAEKDKGRLYDSVLLIDGDGNILLKHRKINLLSELMSPPYTPGEEVNAIDTEFGRIGLLICADTHEAAILERMAELRPDLLLVPYGYAAEEKDWPAHGRVLEKVVGNTARKAGAYVVGTNVVGEITNGPWKGRVYGGWSVAIDRTGGIVSIAKDRDRDIKIFGIDTEL